MMKDKEGAGSMNAKDLLNKPLYDLKSSIKIGEVKSLLVDFTEQRVVFLVIETSGRATGSGFDVNLLRFEDLAGKGDYALMVSDQAQVRRITNQGLYEMLFSHTVSIIGLDLYASSTRIGPLVDYALDPNTGVIGSVTALAHGTAISIEVGKELSFEEGRVYVDPVARLS